MKRKNIALIILAASLLLSIPSFAHSGRTDGSGGHYDHSTGEYHYHHGFPAHQHENGVCPYAFVDKTGERSGTSSGKSEKAASTVTAKKEKQKPKILVFCQNHLFLTELCKSKKEWRIFVEIVAAVCFLLFIFNREYMKSEKTELERLKEECIKEKNAAKNATNAAMEAKRKYDVTELYVKERIAAKDAKYKTDRISFFAKHDGKELSSVVNLPEGATIGKDNLPVIMGFSEKDLWVVTTEKGKCYHRKGCPSVNGNYSEKRIWNIERTIFPCSKCSPIKNDFLWYRTYLEFVNNAAWYGFKVFVQDGILHLTEN